MSDQKNNNQGNVRQSHVRAQGGYQTDGSLRPKPSSTYGFDSKSSLTAKIQRNLAENSQNLPPEKSRLNLLVNLAEALIKKITRR